MSVIVTFFFFLVYILMYILWALFLVWIVDSRFMLKTCLYNGWTGYVNVYYP